MPRKPPQKKRVGRRTSLTTERADTIVRAVQEGNHLTVACALAGVAYSTMWRWIETADNVESAINNGQPYDDAHLPHLEFRDRLTQARARSESGMVKAVLRDAQGGMLISEEPVMETVGGETRVARGDDGEILYKRQWSQPNGRTALQFLARAAPARWGEKGRADEGMDDPTADPMLGANPQVSEPDPAEVQSSEGDVTSLWERLAIVAADRRAGVDLVQEPTEQGVSGEDPVDAEIVEE